MSRGGGFSPEEKTGPQTDLGQQNRESAQDFKLFQERVDHEVHIVN